MECAQASKVKVMIHEKVTAPTLYNLYREVSLEAITVTLIATAVRRLSETRCLPSVRHALYMVFRKQLCFFLFAQQD